MSAFVQFSNRNGTVYLSVYSVAAIEENREEYGYGSLVHVHGGSSLEVSESPCTIAGRIDSARRELEDEQ